MKAQMTLLETLKQEIAREKKKIKRKKFLLKLKVVLCIILPVVITLLTVKAAQTYLKIKLKDAVIPGLKKHSAPCPLAKQAARQETVTPVPVGKTIEPVVIAPEDAAPEPC